MSPKHLPGRDAILTANPTRISIPFAFNDGCHAFTPNGWLGCAALAYLVGIEKIGGDQARVGAEDEESILGELGVVLH